MVGWLVDWRRQQKVVGGVEVGGGGAVDVTAQKLAAQLESTEAGTCRGSGVPEAAHYWGLARQARPIRGAGTWDEITLAWTCEFGTDHDELRHDSRNNLIRGCFTDGYDVSVINTYCSSSDCYFIAFVADYSVLLIDATVCSSTLVAADATCTSGKIKR